jgi:hypothetical protein
MDPDPIQVNRHTYDRIASQFAQQNNEPGVSSGAPGYGLKPFPINERE